LGRHAIAGISFHHPSFCVSIRAEQSRKHSM
jgi:hypothetical protein